MRTGAVVALLLATVAGAFAVGRLTRSTPATTATPPASTLPSFSEDGPVTDRRSFGWRADDNGITVTLRAVTVGVSVATGLVFGLVPALQASKAAWMV